jgi:hypothetical protein
MSTLQLLAAQVASVGSVQVLEGLWLKARLESSVKHEYDRRLEEFKSKETLAIEVAKRRVTALADAWTKIALFEAECWEQSKAIAQHLLEEARKRGSTAIPAELPTGHKEVFDLLSEHMAIPMTEEFMAELQRQVAPQQQKLIASSEEVAVILSSNRFWIGSDLDEELRNYAQEFRDAFLELGPAEAERREFVSRLRAVAQRRWDARSILKRLETS